MTRDPLNDLPPESRAHLVSSVSGLLEISSASAEELIGSALPLWDAMEDVGGLVDSWGGGEFVELFPQVLAFIRDSA